MTTCTAARRGARRGARRDPGCVASGAHLIMKPELYVLAIHLFASVRELKLGALSPSLHVFVSVIANPHLPFAIFSHLAFWYFAPSASRATSTADSASKRVRDMVNVLCLSSDRLVILLAGGENSAPSENSRA